MMTHISQNIKLTYKHEVILTSSKLFSQTVIKFWQTVINVI